MEQRHLADFTSLITRLQHTGHACLQLVGIKSRLLLTSVGSEHSAWFVVSSFYTNWRGVEKLPMHDKYRTISYSTIGHLLRSVSCQVCLHKPLYSRCSRSSYSSESSLLTVFAHTAHAE